MKPLGVTAVLCAVAALFVFAPAVPSAAQIVETIQYGEADGRPLLMDVYRPPSGESNGIAAVVIHGGRWMRGDRGDTPADLIAAQGFVAFSVDYRLAPESPYPAAIQDLQAAVRYIREHSGEFGVEPDKLWAVGGSAGGHLAALLGALGSGPRTQDARVAVAVSWSGPMDLELLAASSPGLEKAATQFVGCSDREDPACAQALREASPVTHLDPSDPPLFIANGTAEPIPFDQAVVGAQAAEEAGLENILWTVEGDLHAFSYAREVLPPTTAFVLNQIEGEHKDIAPPPVPAVEVEAPTAPRETPGERSGSFSEAQRDRGNHLPLVLAILALVIAAVIGMFLLVRGGARRAW
jgi:acetyl esterase